MFIEPSDTIDDQNGSCNDQAFNDRQEEGQECQDQAS